MPAEFPIYMDNHATTAVDPRVVEAMVPFYTVGFGNPGSTHPFGQAARSAVHEATVQVAAAINARPEEIIFTSGATESNNLAIRGVAGRKRRRGNHLVSVQTEHDAVLDPLERLARDDYEVTLLDVQPAGADDAGRLDPDAFRATLRDDTVLASVMFANNEIGVVHPIREIAEACRAAGVLLHCDATQGVGRLPVDVRALGVDLMSFTAHKIYGPKGVGVLYIRGGSPTVRIEPQITGGGQQRGLRSGTLNVPGIVGLAAALQLCSDELETEIPRLGTLRDRLYEKLTAQTPDIALCGPALGAVDTAGASLRLPGNLNVAVRGVDGEALTLAMPEVAVSTGAACASTDPTPSHVLRALGLSDDQARSTLRFGLGRDTTEAEIDHVAEIVARATARLRRLG